MLWDGAGRSLIHHLSQLGALIEFRVDDSESGPGRWHGYIKSIDEARLTLVEPFDVPDDAVTDSARAFQEWRTRRAQRVTHGLRCHPLPYKRPRTSPARPSSTEPS